MKNVFTVSEEFRQRITSVWGEKGREWLHRLPTIITECEERWALSIKSPMSELSYNFVAVVVKEVGEVFSFLNIEERLTSPVAKNPVREQTVTLRQ